MSVIGTVAAISSSPNRPPLTPRLNHRHQQDDRAEQQGGPRPHRQPVGQARRRQPPAPPLRLVQRAPNRPQCQHRQHIPATDRHFVNIGPRQQHRHARRQAERQRAGRHHPRRSLRQSSAATARTADPRWPESRRRKRSPRPAGETGSGRSAPRYGQNNIKAGVTPK